MVSHSSKSKSLNKYLATLAAVALMTGFAASDSQAADCAPAGSIVIGPTMPCPTTTSTQISVNGSGQTTTQASGSTGGDIVIGPSTVVGGTAQSEFGQLLYDWNVAKTTYGTNSTQAQALESQVVSANQAKWDAVNQAVAQVQASATASAGSMTWNEYQQSLSTASTTAPSGAYNYPAATNSTEAYQKVKDGVPLQYEDLYYISSFLLVDPAVQDAVKLATDEHLAAQGGDSGLFTVGGGSTTPIMSTTSDAALAALNAKQNEYFARIEQYEAQRAAMQSAMSAASAAAAAGECEGETISSACGGPSASDLAALDAKFQQDKARLESEIVSLNHTYASTATASFAAASGSLFTVGPSSSGGGDIVIGPFTDGSGSGLGGGYVDTSALQNELSGLQSQMSSLDAQHAAEYQALKDKIAKSAAMEAAGQCSNDTIVIGPMVRCPSASDLTALLAKQDAETVALQSKIDGVKTQLASASSGFFSGVVANLSNGSGLSLNSLSLASVSGGTFCKESNYISELGSTACGNFDLFGGSFDVNSLFGAWGN